MFKQIILWGMSALLLCAIVTGAIWTGVNVDKIKQGMGGSNIYTKEDLEKAYEDGYNKAFTDKDEYLNAIAEYRDTIMIMQDTISHLNLQITSLQTQVSNLTLSNANKDGVISALNSQIATLQASITNLSSQIATLTLTNIGLSDDLYILNNQLAQIQGQSLGYTTTINRLNSLIVYLSSIVIDWENRTEFLATYYVNGQIWDIQVIDHINTAVTVPTSPVGNYTFIGWSLDGKTVIEPTQVPVVSDIDFHAVINVTAMFLVDGITHDTQTVSYGKSVTVPTAPTKATHNFVGWTINGSTVVDPATVSLTQNTTFTAMWAIKTYTVTFKSNGLSVNSQTINHGLCAAAPADPQKQDNYFLGWSIDGTTVISVATYVINADTTFLAVFEAKPVVTFMVEDSIYTTQVAEKNGYTSAPTNPTKTRHEFKGWSLNGTTVVSLASIQITANTTFIAVFEPVWTTVYTGNYLFKPLNNTASATVDLQALTGENFAGKTVRVYIRYKIDTSTNWSTFGEKEYAPNYYTEQWSQYVTWTSSVGFTGTRGTDNTITITRISTTFKWTAEVTQIEVLG